MIIVIIQILEIDLVEFHMKMVSHKSSRFDLI